MTELSPAAQALLDALKEEWVAKPDEMEFNAILAGLGAAALRAAVDYINHDWSGFNCVDALCEIADELEAQP